MNATPVGLEPTIFATGKQRLTIRPWCLLNLCFDTDDEICALQNIYSHNNNHDCGPDIVIDPQDSQIMVLRF